jgi:hypothetical protein
MLRSLIDGFTHAGLSFLGRTMCQARARAADSILSRTTHVLRSHSVKVTLAGIGLLALVAPAGADPCPNLQAPAGNKAALQAYARGVQIYRWDGQSWIFVAPEAVLYTDAGCQDVLGIHYAGPTWQSVSGSKVVAKVLERCTPDSAAIPWLLLGAASTEGAGLFQRVTFIQRVNTVGGLAPTAPGSVADEVARVPYTTEYVFYRAQD